MRIGHIIVAIFAGLAAACTLSIDAAAPTPDQDLSAPSTGQLLTFDLRDSASIPVEVEGRALELLLLARAEALMIIDRDVVQALGLPAVMFGLGSASLRDGDHRVAGEVRRARYRIAEASPEAVWALDLETDIHPRYDGAISFGAIPASRFRLILSDPPADGADQVWIPIELALRSEALEAERDYAGLEFSHDLALYQDPVTANRKAVFYLLQADRIDPVSGIEDFDRLFANTRPHVRFAAAPPLEVSGIPVGRLTGEVPPDFDPDAPAMAEGEDVIIVHHDRRRTVDAPTVYLGRSFFEPCSQIEVVRADQEQDRARIRALCRADVLTSAAPP